MHEPFVTIDSRSTVMDENHSHGYLQLAGGRQMGSGHLRMVHNMIIILCLS